MPILRASEVSTYILEELNLNSDSTVMIQKQDGTVIIEPLPRGSLKEELRIIDQEIKRQGISFTIEEATRDDLYD